ncbi:hypothetical protein HPP92_008988 [Vanilla planifolia]|uniref:Uncharacterized protein n=1 Tax=Vanilla planifolia TaxID=51239 RepID=A0A835R5Q9_VANPL|nr:hypothetical protein HPP92_008988 [Vanilla planifolia]
MFGLLQIGSVRFGCLVERFRLVTSPVGRPVANSCATRKSRLVHGGDIKSPVMEARRKRRDWERKREQEAVDRQRCEMMTIPS